jgi:chromosome segregation protein
MYLKRLEITGFKSFANQTILEFPKPQGDNFSVASIVGPNGSGKSNLLEAIRWALGEQSIKILRGKKAEDIIFSGALQRSSLNSAEVSLLFNNEDKSAPIDYKEFTIIRRLYRGGESEYLINNSKVRLQDILILLAKSNFGQKSYSIVGQGLVDQILQTSPLERKKFFDEATGVRQYQIKKEEALRKMERSQENLNQAGIALSEIVPHLNSLTRQIKKLEKRQEIEVELKKKQKNYYGSVWKELNNQIFVLNKKIDEKNNEKSKIDDELKKIEKHSEILATENVDEQYQRVQQEYQDVLNKKNDCLIQQSDIRTELLLQKEKDKHDKDESVAIEVDPEKIFKELQQLENDQKDLIEQLNRIDKIEDLQKIKMAAQKIMQKIIDCLSYFKKEKTGFVPKNNQEQDLLIEELEKKLASIKQKINDCDEKIIALNQNLKRFNQEEAEKRKKMFGWQKNLQEEQNSLNDLVQQINELRIEQARVETRKISLEDELVEEMGENWKTIISSENNQQEIIELSNFEEIKKLKNQLDLIGGIDPEIIKEYPQIKERHDFLSSQTEDLIQSLKSLNKIIQELDQKTKEQFENNFAKISQEFDRFFKIIFAGGKAKITIQELDLTGESSSAIKEKTEVDNGNKEILLVNRTLNGIEILATPPDKKIKNIEMLSGGEKALTSLALICAIISINKPPFVILDEVDAALDQENSSRFVKIIQELKQHSQFIVITHNQQTVEVADILYGITMNEEGISRLVSMKIEDR